MPEKNATERKNLANHLDSLPRKWSKSAAQLVEKHSQTPIHQRGRSSDRLPNGGCSCPDFFPDRYHRTGAGTNSGGSRSGGRSGGANPPIFTAVDTLLGWSAWSASRGADGPAPVKPPARMTGEDAHV